MEASVGREDLVGRLLAAPSSISVIVAGAGYGKSTLLCQWLERESRPSVLVTVHAVDNNERGLALRLVEALDTAIGGVTDLAERARGMDPDWPRLLLPTLLRRMEGSNVLIAFDDVHNISDARALDLLDALIERCPSGCRIALAGRRLPDLHLARRRLYSNLVTITQADLEFGRAEIESLLKALRIGDIDADRVLARMGGWPAGISIQALVHRSEQNGDVATMDNDWSLRDYLEDEVVGSLKPHLLELLHDAAAVGPTTLSFLESVASSDRRSALAELRRQPVPLVSISDRADDPVIGVHSLLADHLLERVARGAPEATSMLRRTAAERAIDAEDFDGAFEVLERNGDRAALIGFLGLHAQTQFLLGRSAVVRRWLNRLRDDELAHPLMSFAFAVCDLFDGRVEKLAQIMDELGQQSDVSGGATAGFEIQARFVSTFWVEPIPDVALSAELLPVDPPPANLWSIMAFQNGTRAAHFRGDLIEVVRQCRLLADVTREFPLPELVRLLTLALALGDLGNLEAGAKELAAAHAVSTASGLGNNPFFCSLPAVSAFYAMRCNDRPTALAALRDARVAISRCGATVPAQQLLALGYVAEVALWLEDRPLAVVLATEGRDIANSFVKPPYLVERLERVENELQLIPRRPAAQSSIPALSTAELRVLSYLPSHYPVPKIAAELFVSTPTVRTQIASIFRKLGVHNRTDAVSRASEVGLIDRID
jgi:LuxR family transcriptional regulator, maltose regulon positive regulatory protein